MIMLISFMLIKKSVCKAEQPLQGMELKKRSTERIKHTANLFRKNLQLKDAC